MKYEIIVGMTIEAPTFCVKPDSSTPRGTLGKEDSPETGERRLSLERAALHSRVALGREKASVDKPS